MGKKNKKKNKNSTKPTTTEVKDPLQAQEESKD